MSKKSIKVLLTDKNLGTVIYYCLLLFIECEKQKHKQKFNSVSEVQTLMTFTQKPIFHFVPELYHNDSLFQLSNSTKTIG